MSPRVQRGGEAIPDRRNVEEVVKRFGPIQLAVVALIDNGVDDFEEIVETLTSMSIPKSSIYTAIEELVEKKVIGISIGSGGRRKLCLLGRIDMKKILEEKIDLINRLAGISLLLISSLIRRYVNAKTPVKTPVPWINTRFTRVLEELTRMLQDIARGKHRGAKKLDKRGQE